MKSDLQRKICIIGAGAAGLSAAYYLQEKGYTRVTVLEQDEVSGGKCRSYNCDGINHDMGAVEFTPCYRLSLSIMEKLNVVTVPVTPMKLMDKKTMRAYDPWLLFHDESRLSVVVSMLRYFMLLFRHRSFLRNPGFHMVGDELSVPFDDWLTKNRMGPLRNLFFIPLTCYGYGRVDEIPAAYVLKYINAGNMMTMVKASIIKMLGFRYGWPRRVRDGFQFFLQKIEESLRDVRKNVRITGITRKGQTVGGISVRTAGETDCTEFDDLIIAFQPETPALESIGFDLSGDEKALFDRIIHQPYYTTICRTDIIEPGIYPALVDSNRVLEPEFGCPILAYRQTDLDDLVVFYTSIDRSDERSQGDIVRDVENAILRMITEAGGNAEILETRKWDYFPHVSSEDLKDRFYNKFEALQGRNNTYYTGGLCNFESVEHVIEYSKRLVDTHFNGGK